MVGGTGLLGSDTARLFIEKGYEVVTVSLAPLPPKETLPPKMEIHLGNILTMTDQEILTHMQGCTAFVFAAGVDERVEFPAPVFSAYEKYNIAPLARLLPLSKQAGVKKSVVLGSYFTHFAKQLPQLELTKHHPYIRSRVQQQEVAFSFSDEQMDVMVLELPYIFGAQRGRKPVWSLYIDLLLPMKKTVYFPKGGTTMVTVRQVSQCIVGCVEQGKGKTAYPVGWYNKTWTELLTLVNKYMGFPNKKIVTIPIFAYKIAAFLIAKNYKKKGIEPGLNPVKFASLMTRNLFINKDIIQNQLGVTEDNMEAAIADSITYAMEIHTQNQNVIEMKAE